MTPLMAIPHSQSTKPFHTVSTDFITDLPPSNNFDAILSSIRDLEITPEKLREFLPKVNWDQVASLYVSCRTGAECEAQ